MADKIEGVLEVGTNDTHEVVINHPDLKPDENGVGHIVFSPVQALELAKTLTKQAGIAIEARYKEREAERIAKVPPVDRTARMLADGGPETPDHRELRADGQQKGYIVLSDAERAKGFVRPVRDTYKHLTCGRTTTMGRKLAETYARDPEFYSGTFCCTCSKHFPLDEFVWMDGERLGT